MGRGGHGQTASRSYRPGVGGSRDVSDSSPGSLPLTLTLSHTLSLPLVRRL